MGVSRERREQEKAEKLEKQRLRQARDREIKQGAEPDPQREPKSVESPDLQREPKSIEPPDPNKIKLQWCFELFDSETDWRENTGNNDHATFLRIAAHLKDYSRLTWGDLESRKDRDHPIPIPNLIKRARDRLVYLHQEDAGELWRFRFGGRQRIWGIRTGNVLRVVWWDPDHQICPSELRST